MLLDLIDTSQARDAWPCRGFAMQQEYLRSAVGRDVGVQGTWDSVLSVWQLPPGPAPKPRVFGAE